MELYAAYIKEREGMDLIEKDYGFCTYKIINDYIYLADMFITKENRKNDLTRVLLEEVTSVGKNNDCKFVLGSFCLDTNNWQSGKALVKALGFKFFEKQKKTNMIYVIKEI